jgi:hypothetical protein
METKLSSEKIALAIGLNGREVPALKPRPIKPRQILRSRLLLKYDSAPMPSRQLSFGVVVESSNGNAASPLVTLI